MASRTASWVDDALMYRRLGFSVIPLAPRSKVPFPGFSWKPYQTRPPTEDEIIDWGTAFPEANIGIVCGKVSGNLTVYDLDIPRYIDWLRPLFTRLDTPIVETGSGKIHIYLRSTEPPSTTAHSHLGQRLADIKAEGGYVVAPPSIHPDGGAYHLLHGDFAHIRQAPNARELCDQLYARYLGKDQEYRESTLYQDKTVPRPLTGAPLTDLILAVETLPLNSRIRRAILSPGLLAQSGEWQGRSYSQIDYAVCAALIDLSLADERIEEIYAHFPIGEYCYRNTRRPNHGRGYLARTLDNVRKNQTEKAEAQGQPVGLNFKLLAVRRLEADEPQYELTLDLGGQERIVAVDGKDLFNRQQVTAAIGVRLNFFPQFVEDLKTRIGWERFVQLIFALADQEDVPEAATVGGLIKIKVQILLRSDRKAHPPTDPPPADRSTTRMSWAEKDRIVIDGAVLVDTLNTTLRPAPAPSKIWQTIRAMGGGSEVYQFPSGEFAELWWLPEEVLT